MQPAENPPTPAPLTHPEDDPEFIKFWGDKLDRKAARIFRQIKNHYKTEEWDRERIARLCRMANCSTQVLFASIGSHPQPSTIAYWWMRNRWPTSIVVNLARFESYLIQRRFGYVPEAGPDYKALADLVVGRVEEKP